MEPTKQKTILEKFFGALILVYCMLSGKASKVKGVPDYYRAVQDELTGSVFENGKSLESAATTLLDIAEKEIQGCSKFEYCY